MGLRDKLLDLKRRLSDRKMYSIFIVTVAVVAIWGFYHQTRATRFRQELDNNYNRAFFDMVGYVNNVDTLLVKSIVASTKNKSATILQEAWREATLAQTNLSQLPISQQILASTSKFLTQVGDFAYTMNMQNISGNDLTKEEYDMLKQLNDFSGSLGKSLNDLQHQIVSGRLKWGELKSKGKTSFKQTSGKMPSANFESLDKTFQEYPTLIYDGPFSDHMTNVEPKGLTGEKLSVEQAKQKAMEFIGEDKIKEITEIGKSNNTNIETYSFKIHYNDVPEEQVAYIDITQKGGHVYDMLYNRPVANESISIDEAKAKGKKFLEDRGINNMVDTYYTNHNHSATINYAYKQGEVVMYPDLIKVKIALDNGEIIGMEAKGYLTSHYEREIPKPIITAEEARDKINPKLEILSSQLAIIPTEFLTEVPAYEFKGKLDERDFIIYINTQTGKEEDILIIIDTENGVLTM